MSLTGALAGVMLSDDSDVKLAAAAQERLMCRGAAREPAWLASIERRQQGFVCARRACTTTHKRAKAAHGNAERVLAIQALELLETRWGQ